MSAEVSDQVVKMMLNGVEVSAKIAGKATKHLVACLYALMHGDKKISGNTSVAKIVTQSKNIRVFNVKDEDLKTFKVLAKKYGMLYAVIRDKNLGDGLKDIMVKGEDASKLQRVFDIMGYGDVDRDEQIIENDDKKKQASRQEPKSQKSKSERTNTDKKQYEKNNSVDKFDLQPDPVNGLDGKDPNELSPIGEFDLQPDPVNGLDGKDPNELPPTNKKELAKQMHGKSINERKDLANGYIQNKDQIKKPKLKTMQRSK